MFQGYFENRIGIKCDYSILADKMSELESDILYDKAKEAKEQCDGQLK